MVGTVNGPNGRPVPKHAGWESRNGPGRAAVHDPVPMASHVIVWVPRLKQKLVIKSLALQVSLI